jgi:hypothetical protein
VTIGFIGRYFIARSLFRNGPVPDASCFPPVSAP